MVMINGIVAHLVARPKRSKNEHSTSAKIANTKDAIAPRPNGSKNWISPPASSFISFGHPWVSMKQAIPILKISSAAFTTV
ncbi:hypothetical protein GCM10011387_24960 [Pedobacter quisquiliarum]|uniref:Uncharacterized protein n=1 Tax=Pedobacter quisquiliarum TaxID=1834438 RepID=A0A916UF89_9SPHI|nr:hypothetical protein GCM10011387_24960 [Pedobacter quisquiliarum]